MSYDYLESSRYSGTPVKLYLIRGALNDETTETIGPWGFNNGETPINRVIGKKPNGADHILTFEPWPIANTTISHDGTLDKSDVTITMARGSPIDDVFLAYPPSQVVNLTIFEGHMTDTPTEANFPAIWMGRILSSSYTESNEIELSCQPVSTSLRRPGLRRNYQTGCPHVLYGTECGANRAAATVSRTIESIARNQINFTGVLSTTPERYIGGLVEWINSVTGGRELRTISAIPANARGVVVRGLIRGLAAGATISVIRGCNRQMSGCNQHSNIVNYGGQPFIPLENPLSSKNQFY